MKKRIFLLIFLALLSIRLFPSRCTASAADAKKALTLMVYMCGSDLESDAGAATADILEIMESGYDPSRVNVLFMTGGSDYWWSGFHAEETAVYAAVRGNPVRLYSDGLLNMGDPSTLTSFLDYSYERCPAEKYALILWDHGGGPLKGVCWDRLSGNDNLDLFELEEALKASPFGKEPLEWIGFDACLMSSIETAHRMAPFASYMIASQETEPGSGWNYSFLKDIEQDADGGQTGRRIVDAYFETAPDQTADMTLSCLDLSKVEEIKDAMEDFFLDLTVDLTEQTYSSFSHMRHEAKGFGKAVREEYNYDLVDLKDLVLHYSDEAPKEASRLENAIDQAVIAARSNISPSSGISVYHPYYNKELFSQDSEESYPVLSFSEAYTSYLKEFSEIWLGKELTSWQELISAALSQEALDQDTLFSISLPEDLMAHYSDALLLVLEAFESSEDSLSYEQVYVTDQVTLSEDGTLSAVYTGKTLYMTDENGEILNGPLPYEMLDGKYMVPAEFYHKDTNRQIYTMLECLPDPDTDELVIQTIFEFDEETGLFSNRKEIDPQDYTSVFFPFAFRYATRQDDGTLLPFREWDRNMQQYLSLGAYSLPPVWHLQFFDQQQGNSSLYALFQVTDTQNNAHCSEPVPVVNRNLKELPSVMELPEETLFLNPQFTVSLSTSRMDPGILLEGTWQNPSDKRLHVKINDLLINDTRLVDAAYYIYMAADPGQTDSCLLQLDPTQLIGIDQVHSISGTLTIDSPDSIDTLETGTIRFLFDADLTEAADSSAQYTALGQADQNGIHCELLQLKEGYTGGLTGVVLCANRSDASLEVEYRGAAINHLAFIDDQIFGFARTLAPGQEVLLPFQLPERFAVYDPADDEEEKDLLITHDPIGHMGIDQILSFGLLGEDPQTSVTIPLNDPFSYQSHADGSFTGTGLLYEDPVIRIWTDGVCTMQNGAILSIYLENKTDVYARLVFEDMQINDTDAFYIFENEEEKLFAFPGLITHDYLYLTSEETLEKLSNISIPFTRRIFGKSAVPGRVTLTFPEEPVLDLAGEREVALSSIQAEQFYDEASESFSGETSQETGEEENVPLVTGTCTIPENAAQLRIPLSFQIPEAALSGSSEIAYAYLELCLRLPEDDHLDDDGTPVPGTPFSQLGQIDLDLQEDGTCTGTYSGMLLIAGDAPGHIMPLHEAYTQENVLKASLLNETLELKEEYVDDYVSVPLQIEFQLAYDTGAFTLENLAIFDDIYETDYTDYPAVSFDTLTSQTYYGWDLIPGEDGTCGFGDYFWTEEDGSVLELDGQPLALSLVPASEAVDPSDLMLLLRVGYEDGSRDYFGPYEVFPSSLK